MKLLEGGSESCWADSTIMQFITEDENNIKNTLDLRPISKNFENLLKKKLIGNKNENESIQMMDKLLSVVSCNSFQTIRTINLAFNNLKDENLNWIKDKFVELLKKSNIEILDIRNNPITVKVIDDFKYLNIKNINGETIQILSDYDSNSEEYNVSDSSNISNKYDASSVSNDNITIFIPEAIFYKVNKLLLDKNDRKSSFDDLKTDIKNIQITNNLKDDEKNIATSQPKQSTGLLGFGGVLGLGGGADVGYDSSEGIKIIIPKNTLYSFLNMSDKNNRIENINNFISSVNDVELLNNFTLKENPSYLNNLISNVKESELINKFSMKETPSYIKNFQNRLYSTKGGEKKTRKKRGQYKRTRKNKKRQ